MFTYHMCYCIKSYLEGRQIHPWRDRKPILLEEMNPDCCSALVIINF